jgi:hypothetical protein
MDEAEELRLRLRLINARRRLQMIEEGKWSPAHGQKWAITEADLEGDAETMSATNGP